jgi:hypothetical protein
VLVTGLEGSETVVDGGVVDENVKGAVSPTGLLDDGIPSPGVGQIRGDEVGGAARVPDTADDALAAAAVAPVIITDAPALAKARASAAPIPVVPPVIRADFASKVMGTRGAVPLSSLRIEFVRAAPPNGFEPLFEGGVGAAATVGDFARPREVAPLALWRPVGGRALEDGMKIARQVGKLQHLRPPRLRRHVLHLQALALGPRQGFVVGNFGDQRGDVGTELGFDLDEGGVGVLDRVVQETGGNQRRIPAAGRFGQQPRDLRQVIDVGLSRLALAPLVNMLARRKVERFRKKKRGPGHRTAVISDGSTKVFSRSGSLPDRWIKDDAMKTIIEPFRIKSVEAVAMTARFAFVN